MEYIIKFENELKNLSVKNQIRDILYNCDKEFVPPLSSRESSIQGNFQNQKVSELKPKAYFEVMLQQNFLIAYDEFDNIIGFMTFRYNFISDETIELSPSNYITTICVKKEYRNIGITKNFYKYIERNLPMEYKLNNLTTRTWSTNYSHIKILKNIGFSEMTVLKNHRGEGVDTIYFGKKLD
jgi:ribosomal protein S18 acetylase RimI-like enzyme